MYEEFESFGLTSWLVTTKGIRLKGTIYPYSLIDSVESAAVPESKSETGKITFNSDGTTYTLTYAYKDKDRALIAYEYIKQCIHESQDMSDSFQMTLGTMKTADGMYRYCLSHGYDQGFTQELAEKHFGVIAENLKQDEEPLLVFIGIPSYTQGAETDQRCAYALTSERFLCGSWNITGEEFKSFNLAYIDDIGYAKGDPYDSLSVSINGQVYTLGLDPYGSNEIYEAVSNCVQKLQEE